MINQFSIPPIIIATILFYIGIYHLIIYIKGGTKYKKDLTFALGCFFIALNDIMAGMLYNSTTVLQGSFWQTKQPFSYGMGTLFLLWFIHDHFEVGKKKLLILLSFIVVPFCFISLFYTGHLSWRYDISNVKTIHLPFNSEITYYEIASGPITDALSILLIFSFLFYLGLIIIKLYRKNQNKKTLPFIFAFILFSLAGVNDYAIYKEYYQFIYIFEYSFLGIILFMTYSLSQGVLESAFMKDALKNEHDLLQSLLDNIPDLIYFKDSKNNYIRINKAFVSLLELNSQEEIIGKSDYDIFSKKYAKKSHADDQQIHKTKVPIIGKIQNEILPNGLNRWVSITKVPILKENKKIDKIIGISRDITEIKLATKALEKAKLAAESANKVKSQFLANMSHELRTPMNGIIGMLNLALDSEISDQIRGYLNIVNESANNLLELLNALLEVTEIDNNNLELETEEVNIKTFVEDLTKEAEKKIKEKPIDIYYTINSNVPKRIKTDHTRLKQVIHHIYDNAIKFTKKGRVKLTIDLDESFMMKTPKKGAEAKNIRLKFSISDTGIGIPVNHYNNIFKTFYQVDSSSTRKYGGAGTGLAISKKIIDLMGGKIWIESKENQGSTFHFIINTELIHGNEIPTTMIETSIKQSKIKYNVLLVEDTIINQEVTAHIVKRAGHQISIANNGLEALEMLMDDNSFDIILMDLQMPEMDGYETTTAIRNSSTPLINRDIPIVALTAHALKTDKEKCFATGMNEFLTKPVKPDILIDTIESVACKQQYSQTVNA